MTPEQAAQEFSIAIWVNGVERHACCLGKSEKIQTKVDAAKAAVKMAVSSKKINDEDPYEVDVSCDALDDWETVQKSVYCV